MLLDKKNALVIFFPNRLNTTVTDLRTIFSKQSKLVLKLSQEGEALSSYI